MINLHGGYQRTQRLSKKAKRKITFVLVFFILYPFLSIFGLLHNVSPALEGFSISSYANFGGVFFSLYIALKNGFSFPKCLVEAALILMMLLVLNYAFGPYAQTSWFFNWVGFTFFSIVFSQTISQFSQLEMELFQSATIKWSMTIVTIFFILVLITWMLNFKSLITFLSSNQSNHVIAILSSELGVMKQALGPFYAFCIFVTVAFWYQLEKINRVLLLFSFIVFFPSMIGIDTLRLSLSLCLVWVFLTKNESRKILTFFSVILFVPVSFMYSQEIISIVQDSYNRLPSVQFAWSTMLETPFGLGNGGYAPYVDSNNAALLQDFAVGAGEGARLMNKREAFWLAPESDVAYFIASWGVLSSAFFSYFIFVLLKGGRLFHKVTTLPIERVMLLMMAYMIFGGISQDSAGKLLWWICMAAGSGVILRHGGKHGVSKKLLGFEQK